jgi:hypothetical protein
MTLNSSMLDFGLLPPCSLSITSFFNAAGVDGFSTLVHPVKALLTSVMEKYDTSASPADSLERERANSMGHVTEETSVMYDMLSLVWLREMLGVRP